MVTSLTAMRSPPFQPRESRLQRKNHSLPLLSVSTTAPATIAAMVSARTVNHRRLSSAAITELSMRFSTARGADRRPPDGRDDMMIRCATPRVVGRPPGIYVARAGDPPLRFGGLA